MYSGSEVVLEEADEGRRIEIKEGQTIVVSLPANPSTGHRWALQRTIGTAIRRVGKISFEPRSDRLGAPGRQIMHFRVIEPGDTVLSLNYRRPWEVSSEPLRTFSAHVRGVGSFVQGPKSIDYTEKTATSESAVPRELDVAADSSVKGTASAFNWCSQGGCTSVKNQGPCGSCWAFATNAVVESAIKIREGVTRDLSEQYLVSCSTAGNGCAGGWWAFGDYVDEGQPDDGVVYEADAYYQATEAPCDPPYPHHEMIASSSGTSSSVSSIKQAIQDNGPVAAAVCVGPAFQNYPGGVFSTDESDACGGNVNHGIVLVGWDDSLGTNGAWRLKNSWGGYWGESGYMWIEYGTSNVGVGATYANYQGDQNSQNNPPDAPSAPSPSDGAAGVGIGADLSWSGGDPDGDSVTYDVYFEAGDSSPDQLICNDVSAAACDPGTLDYDTRYYWRVVATDSKGASTSGYTWDFRTESAPNSPPDSPSTPSPTDGAVGVHPEADLSWSGGDPDGDPVTYDVYFEAGDSSPDQLICSDVGTATCDPGTLAYGSHYYWRVTATDGHGAKKTGPVWHFVTVDQAIAGFSGSPLEGVAPLDVTFTDQSTGSYSTCAWDFGDGTKATGCGEARHSYASAGVYTAALTISGYGGTDTVTQTDYITVRKPLVAAFVGDPLEGVPPLDVTFTDQSSGDYETCEWDLGDGAKVTRCNDVSHVYSTSGVYDVTLTVSGPTGNDVLTRSEYVTVYDPPEVGFVGEPLEGTAPLQVTFTNRSTGTFDACEWDFGDGTTDSTCSDASHTYDAAGSYTVTLTLTGPAGRAVQVREGYITVGYPVEPVSDLALHQTPTGDVFVGNTVRFHVDAQGTVPFTYSWSVNGSPVGGDANHLELALDEAGSYTVAAAVANLAGEGTVERELTVQQPSPEGQPDLSSSFQMVDPSTVRSGDTLTYTTVLRNNSPVDAEGTFQDPVPAHTEYVEGSAQASDGGDVTYQDGELHWAGRIVSGAPVVIQYRVAVQELDGLQLESISNVGRLRDGLGNEVRLEAEAAYEPTAGIAIDEGALYTNRPTVTLAYRSAEVLPQVQLCSDGRFKSDSGWTTIAESGIWQLGTEDDHQAPVSVYAVFRTDTGEQVGPVHDVIIYDPLPPEIMAVELPGPIDAAASARGAGSELARVTVRDDGSGVARVQVSRDVDFSTFSETAVVTNTATVTLPSVSGTVFLRAVDRAGNYSEIWSEGNYQLYLPLLVRLSP